MVTQDQPWYKKTTVYQIYPRSYMDSTGNGIGDLRGIISKLDYIKELGFETIWFSPFFNSPQEDVGYDISDYLSIAPEYGDLKDCEKLIEEIHKRDMKVIFDLVMNHTSDQHPWFIESRSSKDNPKRDWYIWRDGKKPNGEKPPNNWQSMTSGSGWHYDKETEQWYWAAFLDFQPDLNYRNPEVKKAMFDVMRFWLDKGVDGFRLDIIGSVYEDEEFRDNPMNLQLLPSNDERGMLFRSAKMTLNLEDNFAFVKELRQLVDEYEPPRFMVGEVFGRYHQMVKYLGGENYDGLHSVFLFHTMHTKFNAKGFRKLIVEFEEHFPEPLFPTWVYSNHDLYRSMHRLGNDIEKAKVQAALQLTLRGVPYTYYGEEIGMHQVDVPIEESKDALAYKFTKYPAFITNILMRLTNGAIHRDGCRTPMQWSKDRHAGFSDTDEQTWLPVHENHREINVEKQMKDQSSLLNLYKRFLALRKEKPVLHSGSIELVETNAKDVLMFKRHLQGEDSLLVIANLSKKSMEVDIERCTMIVSTVVIRDKNFQKSDRMAPQNFTIYAYELVIGKLL